MRKDQLLKIILKYPHKYVGDVACWTPKVCQQFTGVKSINTIYNWIKKDKNGEWNFPFFAANAKSANTVKHKILIPIKDFLAWYGYEGQN